MVLPLATRWPVCNLNTVIGTPLNIKLFIFFIFGEETPPCFTQTSKNIIVTNAHLRLPCSLYDNVYIHCGSASTVITEGLAVRIWLSPCLSCPWARHSRLLLMGWAVPCNAAAFTGSWRWIQICLLIYNAASNDGLQSQYHSLDIHNNG